MMNLPINTQPTIEQQCRELYGLEVPELNCHRLGWKEQDSNNVVFLRSKGMTIRAISDVLRCSTRMVQDVLKGLR